MWFRTAKCPVSEKARLWAEESLRWLRGEFGDDALRGEVLLPETVFPPGSYTGSEDDVSVVLRRLCDRIGFPVESVRIEFDDDPDVAPDPRFPVAHRFSGAAGEYRRRGGMAVLAIRRRQLRHPVALAATRRGRRFRRLLSSSARTGRVVPRCVRGRAVHSRPADSPIRQANMDTSARMAFAGAVLAAGARGSDPMHIADVLAPYLIGAATTLIVQLVIQFFVVPRVDTRKRREDRFERNVLELGALLTSEAGERARKVRLEQSIFRSMKQAGYGSEPDQEQRMKEQGGNTQSLTWEFIGFVRTRILWPAERVMAFTPSADEIIKFQLAVMRYLLRAEGIAGWSQEDERTDDEFEAAWEAEEETRSNLIRQVKLLADLPHPPRPVRGGRLVRRRQAARITRAHRPAG